MSLVALGIASGSGPSGRVALGIEAIPLCPTCSYFFMGKCQWCPTAGGEGIPECARCSGSRELRPWWERSQIVAPALMAALITVIATVGSTIVLARMGYYK